MSNPAGQLCSINGEILALEEAVIPVSDHGFMRGDGVFEAFRLYGGVPFRMEDHLARMERSAANLRLPLDLEAMRAETHRLIPFCGGEPGREVLRLLATRGGRRIVMTEPLPEPVHRVRLAKVTYAPTRVLDGVKSLSYAANMLANRLAVERGHDEALLVSPHGRVLEGPTSSVFWVSGGRLFTPPLTEHILASITRAVILELADGQERTVTFDEMCGAEEVFLASSVREVQHVGALEGADLPAATPVADAVAAALAARIAGETAPG